MFVQLFGIPKPICKDFNNMSTKDWFEKDKKDKITLTAESTNEEIKKLNKELDKAKSKLKNVETLINYAE